MRFLGETGSLKDFPWPSRTHESPGFSNVIVTEAGSQVRPRTPAPGRLSAVALRRPPGNGVGGGESPGPPEDFAETHREDLRSLQSGSRVPRVGFPCRGFGFLLIGSRWRGPVDGQPPNLLPHEKPGLPESLDCPALPGMAQRKVSFRCMCGKWAVEGFLLLFDSVALPESMFSPLFVPFRELQVGWMWSLPVSARRAG